MKQLQARELADWLARPGDEAPQLLDVREPWELAVAKIAGSIAIPMGAIVARHQELDRQRPLVCICHHGVRSLQVAYFLEREGFEQVYNLTGGIDRWAHEADPACPTY